MRLINGDTWQHIQLLPITLEELDDARVELLRRLEDLDARARTVHLERNTLQNLVAPTSNLPEEVLAMIFEAGMRQANDSSHFGTLVSHVTRRWRNIALGTPRLWTNIRCTQPDVYPELYGPLNGDRWRERTATFLARSRSLPIDISILRFRNGDFSEDFLELIGNHMGHCRQLRIKNSDTPGLSRVLGYLSTKPAPHLSSIGLSNGEGLLEFYSELFPLGAPRLTHVELEGIEPSSLHLCLPVFQSVTSMRLTSLYIDEFSDTEAYDPFRQCLMAMKSLTHLEVHLGNFSDLPHRLPIVLSALQFLLIDIANAPRHLGTFIKTLRAPSLHTLSLLAWGATIPEPSDTMDIRVDFPSLQHLILNNVSKAAPSFLTFIARTFPDIERLTSYQVVPSLQTAKHCGIDHILAAVVEGAKTAPLAWVAQDGGYDQTAVPPRWRSLKSIAMTTEVPFNAVAVEDLLRKLKDIGHPLSELMLPKILFSQAGTEVMTQLGQLVEFKNFVVDWPTPFACRACGSHTHLLPPTCRKNCFYSDMGGDSRPWESDT